MAIQANLAMPVENTDTFIVPRDALTRRGDEWFLFAVNNNQAQQINVEMVADLGEEVVIANPELTEGQNIVVIGGDGLTDSAAVEVINN
jgi:multidrug efflux pump subunit AcrA (membrane-fusion protein)